MSGLERELGGYVGQRFGAPALAADPVNLPAIRRWVEAMGDANPIHLDDAAARASGRPGLVAPPAMLMVWTMKGYRETLLEGRGLEQALFARLAAAGFHSTPATNCRQRYLRELQPGDLLSGETAVAAISPEKHTALGPGHFVTLATTYRDQHGAVVGSESLRVLAFRPAVATVPAAVRAPSGGASDEGAGAALPPLAIPLDRLAVIACSVACGDYRAGHFDPDAARAIGLRDIIIDIATALGFTQRYVTDWAGPRARVRGIDIRLGVPCCAGDTLRLSGRVIGTDAEGVLSVRVLGETDWGAPISAIVELAPD
jgi:acyl dehydratase